METCRETGRIATDAYSYCTEVLLYKACKIITDQGLTPKTVLILSQFGPKLTAYNRYKEKLQRYIGEKNSIREDISLGIVYGLKNFVDRNKKKCFSNAILQKILIWARKKML